MLLVLTEGSSGTFHGRLDPEELFRRIFGDHGFQMSGFDDYDDFEESDFGFATASHVCRNAVCLQLWITWKSQGIC